jgi:UDP-N-acetyl-alpha-D-muramoyl-L-alanyl-L-glutamate epimerase
VKTRAELFRYVGLDVSDDTLTGHYELDGRPFVETVTFDGVRALDAPAVVSLAQLWYLVAGLSYYKAGAARRIDVGTTSLGKKGRRLFEAALRDGLGEFAFNNQLTLSEVTIEGGVAVEPFDPFLDPQRVLTPFGGGIDSVVTVERLRGAVDQSLFIVSPPSGRFAPLEATAAVTGLDVVRATRTLDPQMLAGDETFFNGHVPVTTMVILLAAIAAVASGRGGVALANEHSASVPNLRWYNADINHQWSKSWAAELLIADAIAERVGDELVVASYLRDRSELWVAKDFSSRKEYHHVFRSCNRAFTQRAEDRAQTWCGECDKCVFINLMLAPFLSRSSLREIFDGEPLSDPERAQQLRTLVGIGVEHKPFECVGDPDECTVALCELSHHEEWSDVQLLEEVANRLDCKRSVADLLTRQGPSRVPTHWLR